MFQSRKQLHRKVNDVLAAAVIVFGGYLAISPFAPEITYYAHRLTNEKMTVSTPQVLGEPDEKGVERYDVPNTLVIPKIGVDSAILESENASILNQGLWRRPHSSTPSDGGNTVIVAHRFQYTFGSQTFYHLDKLEIGDSVITYWDTIKTEYKVTNVQIVNPDEVTIEGPTKDETLTLYTCTPLWTAQKRLVVTAKPIL